MIWSEEIQFAYLWISKNEDDFKNIIIIERIANIFDFKIEKIFRLMDNKDEVYEFIKQIPALNNASTSKT